jgi:hypothetical protein
LQLNLSQYRRGGQTCQESRRPKAAGYAIIIGHEDHLLGGSVVTLCHIAKVLTDLAIAMPCCF